MNVDESPGVPNSLKKIGPPLGASGSSGFDATNLAPIGGRTGAAGSRAPREAFDRTTRQSIDAISQIVKPAILLQAQVASYGELDLPDILDDEGPSNGLTLDTAIETLMRENLSLQALRFEIPMAHADILTASLRATATLALRSPLRLASLTPQALTADHFGTRVSRTPAASNR